MPSFSSTASRHRQFVFLSVLAAIAGLPGVALAQEQDTGGQTEAEEGEEIVVQATRFGRRVQDEPIRVEVIGQEEIAEKLLMTPGNIAMLVAETGGLRVQVASPALGASNVRVRGLEGRYTQILSDGLPLYGGQAIGLLQIPPTDLRQVEVIKGAASALYGPAALGGVINLVSRRPGEVAESEFIANATSRNGQDLTGYAATALADGWGTSIVGGYHRQSRQDLDGDGWADMPGYERVTFRPRIFWDRGDGVKAFLTAGAMTEDRKGGTLPGRTAPDGSAFVEAQNSTRLDAGFVGQMPLEGIGTVHLRASAMNQEHRHRFGDLVEDDRHSTLFAELSLAGTAGDTSWLAGSALQVDAYRSRTFANFDYTYTVPALFAQIEQTLGEDVTLAGSARLDVHDAFGTRLSPRLSALYRPGNWTIRTSLGRGFFAPTPFVEEIEATGLSRLQPLDSLRAEVADTASIDVGYAIGGTEATASLFGSRVENAVRLDEVGADSVRLVNVEGTTRTRGIELLLRQRLRDVSVTGSYVYIDAREPDPSGTGRRAVPRTPRHSAGVVAMWEKHGTGRIGVEAYYTGRQQLDDNPYRSRSRPYVELGLLGEIALGRASLFLNLENILGVRQTKYDPILRRRRAADGRWTVDAWGPTDGFVANGGVRLRFGGE
ncbi:TonB-dependent receptor plug domain-containing protein [Allosphingosinicella deserti]|uniref:TonB-dependent receptor n=1 Tax=Allosphingosinicella deserti TaxID=2116704 RepID=A0A2P7QWI3_9SPHN|nr:TonB-dependent receptor [Sphingomonas deserti]PSJ42320.1 TonB-dependent receptor [Sphingomonas deserti]